MDQSHPDHRHRLERRLTLDRRRGFDRRIADRRLDSVPTTVERRVTARRTAGRRALVARRSWSDRRGSGLSFTGPLAD